MGKQATAESHKRHEQSRVTYTVRIIALILAVLMVIFGFWVIWYDRPTREESANPMGMEKWCTTGTDIGISNFQVTIMVSPSGYIFEGALFFTHPLTGSGKCIISTLIPDGVSQTQLIGFQRQAPKINQGGDVALITIDAKNREPKSEVGLFYYSPGVSRNGWGKLKLSIPTVGVKDGPAPVAIPNELLGTTLYRNEVEANESLSVMCPSGSDVDADYPNNGILPDSNRIEWDNLAENTYVQLTCQNSQIRFWVDHATDLIVLGVGAILGLLVALEPRRKRGAKEEAAGPKVMTAAQPGDRIESSRQAAMRCNRTSQNRQHLSTLLWQSAAWFVAGLALGNLPRNKNRPR